MGRIDFDAVKAAVSMEDVLADYSIALQRGGWAICPLHADRHPSLKVYKDGYYCFACGNGGDIITFVARMENVKNVQAAALIMARHGVAYGDIDTDTRRRRQEEKQRQEAFAEMVRRDIDALCMARRADGGPYSEWDYWLDLIQDAPEEFYRLGGRRVLQYVQRVYGEGTGRERDLRRDFEDRGRDDETGIRF